MKTSFPEIASAEVGRLLAPLKNLNTPQELSAFIRELGYSFDGVAGSLDLSGLVTQVEQVLDKIKDLAEAETDEQKADAVGELTEEIVAAITKFKDEIPHIQTALSSVSNLTGEDLANFTEVFLRRAMDCLIYTYVQDFRPAIFGVMYLMKLADTPLDTASNQPYKLIHWDQLGPFLKQPMQQFDQAYDWKTDFQHESFLERFAGLLRAFHIAGGIYTQTDTIRDNLGRSGNPNPKEIRISLYQKGTWGSDWKEIDLNLSPIPEDGSKKPGLFLYPYLFAGVDLNADISDEWIIELNTNADLGGGLGVEIRPELPLQLHTELFTSPLESLNLFVELLLRRKDDSQDVLLFGTADGTHLSYKEIEAHAFVQKNNSTSDAGIELQAKGLKFVFSPSKNGDGFLKKLIANNITVEFDLGLGYAISRGFYFEGSGGLDLLIPVHKTILGVIDLESIPIGIRVNEEGLYAFTALNGALKLGPFTATIEEVGIKANLSFPEDGGNLGPMDFGMDFKPPRGIGLALDTPAIKGGGYLYFDPENEQYAGVAELSIGKKENGIQVKAIGLLTTRLPGNPDGYSLLLLITAEFSPIQLGFGFTLNGVGGLIGLNRSMELQVLRDGVKNDTLDNILFPTDPLANAPQIISDLQSVFPATEGRYAFGPMGIIGYGTPSILTVEMGLMIELPQPIRLAVLGVLKMNLPDENARILRLQVNFLGTIDFEQKYITFDASLFDSRLLAFTLSGDMAFRLKYGENPYFLLSVGGFHPQFQAPPLNLPTLKRLTISLSSGDRFQLTLQSYVALTSNTAQFGARVDLLIKITNKYGIVGMLGFDALFQFSPFYFSVSFQAMLALKNLKKNKVIVGGYIEATLEGPSPWKISGKAWGQIGPFYKEKYFNKTWGEQKDTVLPNIAVLPKLVEQIESQTNWQASLPAQSSLLVTLKNMDKETEVVAHPYGILAFNQKQVPLGVEIEKFGQQRPSDHRYYDLEITDDDDTPLEGVETLSEHFAPGDFEEMSQTAKLSSPSFEKMRSGLTIKGDQEIKATFFRQITATYEHVVMYNRYIPTIEPEPATISQTQFQAEFGNGSASRSARGRELFNQQRPAMAPAKVQMQSGGFVIANRMDLSIHDDIRVESEAEARMILKSLSAEQPELAATLQIVPELELALA